MLYEVITYMVWLAVIYPRMVKKRAQDSALSEIRNLPLITVIVPAFNEERNIVSKIEDVFAQDYPVENRITSYNVCYTKLLRDIVLGGCRALSAGRRRL